MSCHVTATILPVQVQHVDDVSRASRLIFPGVGAYGQAMERLKHLGYVEALKDYIQVAANGLTYTLWCYTHADMHASTIVCETPGLVSTLLIDKLCLRAVREAFPWYMPWAPAHV